MKKPKIFVLVKNFEGVNHDVELYGSLKEAKREFKEYTDFAFNKSYCDPHSEKYDEKFSETKIFELDLPGFLEIRKGVPSHEKRQR
jgi:hypothetical protein